MRLSQKVEEIKRSINLSAQAGGGGIGHLAAGAAWELTEPTKKRKNGPGDFNWLY